MQSVINSIFESRAKVLASEASKGASRDADRYAWLTKDHPSLHTRIEVGEICRCIATRTKKQTDEAVDAAMNASNGQPLK